MAPIKIFFTVLAVAIVVRCDEDSYNMKDIDLDGNQQISLYEFQRFVFSFQ